MDDVKDKFKDLMKNVNKPFSSSSGKFKGKGRVLGSSSTGPASPVLNQPLIKAESGSSVPTKKSSSFTADSNPQLRQVSTIPTSDREQNYPNPFKPFISSGNRNNQSISENTFECPVCNELYQSEEEVSGHIENCLNNSLDDAGITTPCEESASSLELKTVVLDRTKIFLSGNPPEGSLDIILKLLKNVLNDPGNDKFRRIRLNNLKIKNAIEVPGGLELLETVGFNLQEEGGEMWGIMVIPTEEQLLLIKKTVSLLEQHKKKNPSLELKQQPENQVEIKGFDRQVHVFFSVSENIAAKINLPDSFYTLSAAEIRREAELRRKINTDSQLLIPKSYKERQAKASKKTYKVGVIRIQFPDGVVLQGLFKPWETVTTLYEFVSSALKEPRLEFELLHPSLPKRRVIPRFVEGKKAPTLEEEELVPSALVKFKPFETDSIVYTGLSNELLLMSEPLTSSTPVLIP